MRYFFTGFLLYICLTPQLAAYLQVNVGEEHSCALKNDATLACWGYDTWGQATPPAGYFLQLEGGAFHTCAVAEDASLACWGLNDYGQSRPPEGRFSRVSAGDYHSCALSADAAAACWGNDGYGQATAPAGEFTQIGAGAWHSCALQADGEVACWGAGLTNTGEWPEYGQSMPPQGPFTQLSVGGLHTCALREDRSLACWGRNDYGQTDTPPGQFVQVAAGWFHSCAVDVNAAVLCWGLNDEGQASPPAGNFTQVAADWRHSCALQTDGGIACWGYDYYGQTQVPADATQPATVSLTLIQSGAGTVSGAGDFVPGATVSLQAVPAEGYEFIGWTPSPCAETFAMPAQALSCTAQFSPRTFRLELADNPHGTLSGGGDFYAGDTVILEAEPIAGYEFVGWTPAPCAETFAMPAQALSCAAQFVPRTFRLELADNPHGALSGAGDFAAGETVNLEAVPAAGYEFVGWTPAPCAASFLMPEQDLNCTAQFNPLPVQVAVTLNQSRYRYHDPLQFELSVSGPGEALDLYAALLFPEGFFMTIGQPLSFSAPDAIQPFQTNIVPAGENRYTVLDLAVPPGVSPGLYQACGVVTAAGADARDSANWRHLDCQTLTLE